MKTVTRLFFAAAFTLGTVVSSPARAAEPATQYRYNEAGIPVAAWRGKTAVRVAWDRSGRRPLEVVWNDGRKRIFEYDAAGRRVATRDGEAI